MAQKCQASDDASDKVKGTDDNLAFVDACSTEVCFN